MRVETFCCRIKSNFLFQKWAIKVIIPTSNSTIQVNCPRGNFFLEYHLRIPIYIFFGLSEKEHFWSWIFLNICTLQLYTRSNTLHWLSKWMAWNHWLFEKCTRNGANAAVDAFSLPQLWLHMNTYEPLFGCLPTSVFVTPFLSNRQFFEEIATYQASNCRVMNDTGELMQTTTTKTRKSKRGKVLKPESVAHLFLLPSKD